MSEKKPEIKHGQMHTLRCGVPLKYNEEKLIIDPATIPTLSPEAAVKEWITEENPVYTIQEISFPIKANGYFYDESFFKSFLNANSKRPFAGSALGHSYGARGKTDLIMVGGLLKSNGDGTGKVYFKNYILPGDGSLKREWHSGMIHFSLISMTRDELRMNADREWEWHVVASEGAERNDVVDNGAGAMKQKVNKHKINNKEKPGVSGEDNINNKEGDNMPITKQDVIDQLKANTLTFPEVVQVYGVSDQIVTDVHKNAVKTMNDLKALNCTDPVKELTELRINVAANFSIMRNAKLDKEFGFLEVTIGNEKKANALRVYAGEKLGDVSDKDYDAVLKNLKENDIVAKTIAEQFADSESKINIVVGDKEKTKPANKPYDGFSSVPVEKVE